MQRRKVAPMDQVRILNANEVGDLLTIPLAIDAVEAAYLEKHRGSASVWPLLFHEFAEGVRDMDLKSGNLDGEGLWGLKAISCYQDNPQAGLPVYHGTSLVFDYATGTPKALLNAMPITRYRTGAAGAIGARWLARKDSRVLAVCGDGGLAPFLIAANLICMPQIERVLVANPRHPSEPSERVDAIVEDVDRLLGDADAPRAASIEASTLEAAVRAADVIMTATPSYAPGTHISCVGADKSGKQEVESTVLAQVHVVVDDLHQCFTVGECELPHVQGMLPDELPEIGSVIAGDSPARTSYDEVTVFDSTGLSLQDLATISRLVARAESEDVGTLIEL